MADGDNDPAASADAQQILDVAESLPETIPQDSLPDTIPQN